MASAQADAHLTHGKTPESTGQSSAADDRSQTSPGVATAKVVLTAADLQRIVDRIAHQILEKTSGATGTVLLGIPTRGVPLAQRLAARIHAFEGIDGRRVILVDDVLFSGRTVRAALDAINDVGRPSSVQLAVLVDRGHRQLPIRADYVGKNIPTALTETVHVLLTEIDGTDEVRLEEKR